MGQVTRQRGNTLIEMTIVVAIAAASLIAWGSVALAHHPGALGNGPEIVGNAVLEARALAQASGNGATIVVRPGDEGFVVDVYSGRPDGGTLSSVSIDHETSTLDVSSNVAGSSPLAIFIDAYGDAQATSWSPDRGSNISAPGCPPSGIMLSFSNDGQSLARTISCSDVRMN